MLGHRPDRGQGGGLAGDLAVGLGLLADRLAEVVPQRGQQPELVGP
jgi:hypothetical protein